MVSVVMLWLAPGVRFTRYELVLAGVIEPEQYSPAPPANKTCTHNHESHAPEEDSPEVLTYSMFLQRS